MRLKWTAKTEAYREETAGKRKQWRHRLTSLNSKWRNLTGGAELGASATQIQRRWDQQDSPKQGRTGCGGGNRAAAWRQGERPTTSSGESWRQGGQTQVSSRVSRWNTERNRCWGPWGNGGVEWEEQVATATQRKKCQANIKDPPRAL